MNTVEISSSAEQIKYIKKAEYIKDELFLVDDLYALSLVQKPLRVKFIIVCKELVTSDESQKILENLYKLAEESFSISKKVFIQISAKDNAAGIIALVEKPKLTFNSKEVRNSKFVLINDSLEIPGNLGSIFRTADAVNVDLIINTNPKTSIYNNKVLHGSRGMVLTKNFINCEVAESIKFLQDNNYKIMLCEPEAGVDFSKADYSDKVAIVVGNERYGISKEWFNNKHNNIFIPMAGQMNSLNVATATSIILYQAWLNRTK